MAKSIRLTEIEAPRADITAPLSHGLFWEHWFDNHTQRHSRTLELDEHSIWEKAVNLEILADEGKKY